MTTTNTQTAFQRARTAIEAAKAGYTKHLQGNGTRQANELRRVADIRGNVNPGSSGAALANIQFTERNRAFANSEAYAAMNKAVDGVRARHEQAKARLTEIRRGLSSDGDIAAELRATRYWNRTKSVLDSFTGTHSTNAVRLRIEKAIAEATPAELGTLLQEVEGYCESRKLSTNGWLEPALDKAIPNYVQAKRDIARTEQAVIMVESNAGRIRSAVESGFNAPMVIDLPDNYDPDGTI